MFDLLVLGSGIAGLSGAVHASRAGWSVLVLTKGELAHSATRYAQGGVAAALDVGPEDSPELHRSDTIAAGAGLCDPDAVRVLVTEGPDRVRELIAMGAVFDQTGDGEAAGLALAREGGHSAARVLHAGGDATGAEIERALVAAVEATPAEVREGWLALELLVEGGRAAGVTARAPDGAVAEVRARHTLVATGGAGQCFAVTTNPALSTGDGIAMALRAGAAVADVEFMQFHPTALHHPAMPRPLLSEALRGEGAVLRDSHGHAFMADEHPLGDLAPRDIVARAITRRLHEQHTDHLWLDATSIAGFEARFPTIWRACRAVGLDPHHDWLPVAPAAHYLCGGVCTDLDGATNVPRLWACGEAACSGVHGANRLASNSLLDGLVFAHRAVDAIARGKDEPDENGVLRGVEAYDVRAAEPTSEMGPKPGVEHRFMTHPGGGRDDLQRLMTREAGVLRDAASLERAATQLAAMAGAADPEVRNLVTVGGALVDAARARTESRGTHTRLDYPEPSSALLGRFVFAADEDLRFVPLPEPERVR
ncbi:MAG TPA: L-aspartate oxidase [Acidimicrobiia bacterium]|nr:L-aspartate oxidase [Acidimicrobiia bacterium]